jgi:hypothetical protein
MDLKTTHSGSASAKVESYHSRGLSTHNSRRRLCTSFSSISVVLTTLIANIYRCEELLVARPISTSTKPSAKYVLHHQILDELCRPWHSLPIPACEAWYTPRGKRLLVRQLRAQLVQPTRRRCRMMLTSWFLCSSLFYGFCSRRADFDRLI